MTDLVEDRDRWRTQAEQAMRLLTDQATRRAPRLVDQRNIGDFRKYK